MAAAFCPVCFQSEFDPVCAICQNDFVKPPTTLPACRHSFCQDCLVSNLQHERTECSLCRTKIEFPVLGDVSSLPLNFTLYNNFVSQLGAASIPCSVCGDQDKTNPAAFKCKTCNIHLCKTHAVPHRVVTAHTLVSADISVQSGSCPYHRGLEVALYCASCEALGCSSCFDKEPHLAHNRQPVTYDEKCLLSLDVACSVEDLKSRKQKIQDSIKQLEDQLETINLLEIEKSEVMEDFDAVITGADERLSKLMKQLENSIDGRLKEISEETARLKRLLSMIDIASEAVDALEKKNDHVRMLELNKFVRHLLKHADDDTLILNSANFVVEDIESTGIKLDRPPFSTDTTPSTTTSARCVSAFVHQNGSSHSESESERNPSELNDPWNDRQEGNDEGENQEEEEHVLQISQPDGIVFDGRNRLIVTLPEENCVAVFAGERKILTFGCIGEGALQWPTAVAVNSIDEIIVADTANCRIAIFSSGGQFLRSFKGRNASPLKHPTGLAVDSDDNIIVAECSKNRVSKFCKMGDYISSMDLPIDSMVYKWNVYGIAVHNDNRIIVPMPYTRSVGVFSSNWQLLFSLQDDSVQQPTATAVTSSGLILVAHANGLAVFDSDGEFVKNIKSEDTPENVTTRADGRVAVAFKDCIKYVAI